MFDAGARRARRRMRMGRPQRPAAPSGRPGRRRDVRRSRGQHGRGRRRVEPRAKLRQSGLRAPPQRVPRRAPRQPRRGRRHLGPRARAPARPAHRAGSTPRHPLDRAQRHHRAGVGRKLREEPRDHPRAAHLRDNGSRRREPGPRPRGDASLPCAPAPRPTIAPGSQVVVSSPSRVTVGPSSQVVVNAPSRIVVAPPSRVVVNAPSRIIVSTPPVLVFPVYVAQPRRCFVPGYWAYAWVPQSYQYGAWVDGQYSAEGLWLEGYWEPRTYSWGSYQPYWIPESSADC